MAILNRNEARYETDQTLHTEAERTKAHVKDAANKLLDEGKKFASEMYHEGSDKLDELQTHAKEYSDHVLKKVQDNPLSAVLIAGGVGFLLSVLLRK